MRSVRCTAHARRLAGDTVTSPRTHGTWSAAVLVSVDAVADLDERRLTASPAAARSVAGRADAREAGEVSAGGS